MKKTLILVGNKPPRKRSLAKKINRFDFVIRINRMNYLGKAGTKTDGIFYEANWQINNAYKGGKHLNTIKYIPKIFMRNHWHRSFTNWKDFITKEQYDQIEVINESFANEETKCENSTNAIKVLAHLLHTNWSKDYQIFITCLDIENRAYLIDNLPIWSSHKGAGLGEQEFLERSLTEKKIFRINDY